MASGTVIACPQCTRVLGDCHGPIFVSVHRKRITVGGLPALIVCNDCGGVWLNPDFTADQMATVTAFLANQKIMSQVA